MNTVELDAMLHKCGIPLGAATPWDDSLRLEGVRSASRLPPEAKSVIICAFPYYFGVPRERNLALYAMLPDYHTVVLHYLEKLCEILRGIFPSVQLVAFADASPVDELEAALRAGLGVRGENGLLITEQYGSFIFLGEIVTDIILPYGKPRGGCLGCGACKRACPGGALGNGKFRKELCLSFISQKKGVLNEDEIAALRHGGLAWGCDRCQLACPLNHGVRNTTIPEFADIVPMLTQENTDMLMKNRAFAWRGKKVIERNLSILEDIP